MKSNQKEASPPFPEPDSRNLNSEHRGNPLSSDGDLDLRNLNQSSSVAIGIAELNSQSTKN